MLADGREDLVHAVRRLSLRLWRRDCLSHVILRADRHDVTAAVSKK
jgi:hypothetical protein